MPKAKLPHKKLNAEIRKGSAERKAETKAKYQVTAYKKRFLSAYKKLLESGMATEQIETIFGIGNNLSKMRKDDPEFMEQWEESMQVLERQLSSQILVQALGYDYEEERITYVKNPKYSKETDEESIEEWIATKKEHYIKHQPGNAQAFTLFMTNKFRDKWKMSREIINRKETYDKNPRKQIVALARDVLEANSDESDGEHKLSGRLARVSCEFAPKRKE